MEETRICKHHGELPLNSFYKAIRKNGRIEYTCKFCQANSFTSYYKKRKDFICGRNQKYYKKNRERILMMSKEYYEANRGNRARYGRKYHDKDKGLILERLKECYPRKKRGG